MLKIFLFILSGFILIYAQDELGVEDVIQIGLKNNYAIQIARNNVEIADNNRTLGVSGFLPTLDASGSYQQSSSSVETNSPFGFGDTDREILNGQLQLNWTLFDGFKMFIDRKRYNQLAELGEFQARHTIESAVVAIMRAYFNLVQQEQLLAVAESTLAISQIRLDKAKVRNDLGGASSTDFLNARVSFNNDKSNYINQQLNVEIARKELNIILGREPDVPLTIQKKIVIAPLLLSYEEIVELTKNKNSQLAAAQKNMEIARQNKYNAATSFLPRVSAVSSYNLSDQTDDTESRGEINSNSEGLSAGLSLSWNLFNGFRNRVDVQNKKLELKNQQLALFNEENRLAGLVKEKYDTYHKRIELLLLEEENVVAAEQNLKLQQDRFDIGTSTSLEFRDAQMNLVQARNRQITVRYQARISRLEIDQLIGDIEIK
ncbi:MAG: TolC family protein [Calditrichaceae bacterium]|nr:TolC family protein [Calditrichaceae bacterium]